MTAMRRQKVRLSRQYERLTSSLQQQFYKNPDSSARGFRTNYSRANGTSLHLQTSASPCVRQSFIHSVSHSREVGSMEPSLLALPKCFLCFNKKYFSRRAPVPSGFQQQTESASPHPRIWPTRSEFHPSETKVPRARSLGSPGGGDRGVCV